MNRRANGLEAIEGGISKILFKLPDQRQLDFPKSHWSSKRRCGVIYTGDFVYKKLGAIMWREERS